MKIAILSMQRVLNYGSVLQAYSLKKLIHEITGTDPQFIDIDRSDTVMCNRLIVESMDYSEPVKEKSGFWHRVKRKIFRKLFKYNNEKINSFAINALNVLDGEQNETYDCVVVGSDEVFNTSKGISLQLYGNIKNAKKVISYAASCGTAVYDEIPMDAVSKVKSALTNYAAMSVRDKGTEQYIARLYDGMVERHLDPVLVGGLNEHKVKPVLLKRYIIIYAYGGRIRNNDEILAIQSFAGKRKLKTIAIGGSQTWCDYYIPLKPLRVLDYFYNAEFIVTDTFHGTIFSVINRKQFVSIVRKTNSNKLTGLLQDLGLEDRMLTDINRLEEVLVQKIDYGKVENIINRERIRTQEYLKRNLVGVDENGDNAIIR